MGNRSAVYMPDHPGCSLVRMIDHRRIRRIEEWAHRHPDGVVISYVNTDARAKAMSHYVCTSANAAQVLDHAARRHPGKRILFLPDRYLGSAALAHSVVNPDLVDLYHGSCHVHASIGEAAVEEARRRHPDAEILIHPECAYSALLVRGVPPPSHLHFLSSERMLRYAATSPAEEFVVATETGLIYRLRVECPGKRFYPVSGHAVCEYMKMNTLVKLRDSLRYDQSEITIDREVREKARQAVRRMLAVPPARSRPATRAIA